MNKPNPDFTILATQERIDKTITALKQNGIDASFVPTAKNAKDKVLSLVPKGAEVFTMTSRTLEAIGVAQEINESGDYKSVRKILINMNPKTDRPMMRKIGTTPDYALGSVQAVTEDGKAIIASNTGSQIPAYTYGAEKVIWVVGAQKLVKDEAEGRRRINDYTLFLESERLHKLFGVDSFVSKLLIVNREITPGRITLIIVGENLGF